MTFGFRKPAQEYLAHLRQIFEIYRKKDFVMNTEKCQLGQSEVEFLERLPVKARKVDAIVSRSEVFTPCRRN